MQTATPVPARRRAASGTKNGQMQTLAQWISEAYRHASTNASWRLCGASTVWSMREAMSEAVMAVGMFRMVEMVWMVWMVEIKVV